MKKHFKAFQDFIESLNFKFNVTCFSETWLQPHEISDSNFQILMYYSFHLTREKNREGGVCIFYRKLIHIKSEKTSW